MLLNKFMNLAPIHNKLISFCYNNIFSKLDYLINFRSKIFHQYKIQYIYIYKFIYFYSQKINKFKLFFTKRTRESLEI